MTMPFLPADLTVDEKQLVATITRQLLAARNPRDAAQEQAVRLEAAQMAAETIWEARAALQPGTPSEDEPDSGYHQRLRRTLQRTQEIARQEAIDSETPQDLADRAD